MARQPSTETQLRTARADIRRLTVELVRAEQQATAYRTRATQAEQEAAQWKQRFDTLLVITKDGPKKDAAGVAGAQPQPAAQCAFCERPMIAGSECLTADRAAACEVRTTGVALPQGGSDGR